MKPRNTIIRIQALKILAAIWLSVVATGAIILLIPEGTKRLLVSRNGWQITGSFFNNISPSSEQLSPEIAGNSQAVFWRSWSPETNAVTGSVSTAPFHASGFLVVPYVGYPAKQGISLYVECSSDGKRTNLAEGDAHEDWVERLIWLPAGWCTSDIRVVASSRSRNDYVGVGTPASASFLSYLKESVFTIVFIHFLMFTLLFLPGMALAVWLNGRIGMPIIWVVPATLLLGYIAFFLAYYANFLGKPFAVGCNAGGFLILWLNRWKIKDYLKDTDAWLPLVLMFLVSLGFVLFLYIADNGLGTWSANYRFAPVIWSSDNQLQQIVADKLYKHQSIIGLNQKWKTSDRPPLVAGCFTLSRPLWEPILRISSNERLGFYFYQILGIIAMTFWVVPAWLLFKSFIQFSSKQSSAGILILACTSFAAFNSIYIWGKMLAAALALCAYFAVFNAGEEMLPFRKTMYWVVAGVSIGLGLMSHAGVVFGLVPLIAVFFLHKYRGSVTNIAATLTGIVLIVAPWALWQHFEEPPGNALVKFAFAGTYGFGEEHLTLWQTIWRAYSKLSLAEWVNLRWDAVKTLFGAYTPADTSWLSSDDVLAKMRLRDFLFLFPSLRILNLTWPLLLTMVVREAPKSLRKNQATSIAVVAVFGIGGIIVNVLTTWNMNIIHHLSYVSILMILAALTGALLLAPPRLRYPVILMHLTYFGIVWGIDPLKHALHIKWDICVGFLLDSVALCLLALYQPHRSYGLGHADCATRGPVSTPLERAVFQPRQ